MLSLENQVCTLEQAKIFKDEFGLELESYLFQWKEHGYTDGEMSLKIIPRSYGVETRFIHYYPAYTCAELGVLLPLELTVEHIDYLFGMSIHRNKKQKTLHYTSLTGLSLCPYITNPYEAHGKADLLIDGLRKGYIKPEDLKL